MFLEEVGLDYTIHPVDISAGDQFKPEFLALSPNNRMPAIIDTAPEDEGEAVTVFESGAILTYLADKTGRFLPKDLRGRKTVMEWLFWQVGGLGPMAGQNHHFVQYAREKIPYDRSLREGNKPTLWCARPPVRRPGLHCRRRLHDRRHGVLFLARALAAPATES
jgi:GST-like protein